MRRLLSRLGEDALLLALILALLPLLVLAPVTPEELPGLVDWNTIAALAGLMMLSRGLEDSGYLAEMGRRLLHRMHGERRLAAALVTFSAALAAVVTNDVALFIVVPLTLALRAVAALPIGRLIIFEALAVNAGSTASPMGNPQNLFLWQTSGAGFLEFTATMLPLGAAFLLVLLLGVPVAFPARRIEVPVTAPRAAIARPLLALSLASYPVFLLLIDLGWAVPAAACVVALYAIAFRRVLAGVDWVLLAVFVLMFVDLGLLARMPAVGAWAQHLDQLPGGTFLAGALLSQAISNVPAAIFLEGFTADWAALAWGVNAGGFGLAIGSLANLIALRLARERGLWREFHLWSVPMLAIALLLGLLMLGIHSR
jgi:Na+/H+ antiporter NhaD/arsenite permease-like protein